jgi:hypothetical protein
MYYCLFIFYKLLYGTLNIVCRSWDFEYNMEFRKARNLAIFVIMVAGALTTIGVFSVPSVFADKCDKNENNNCNDTGINQKTWTDNRCKLENLDNDRSNENVLNSTLACVNVVGNLEDLATIPDQFAATS